MKHLSELIFDISRQVGWFPPCLLPVGNMKSTPSLSLLQRRGRDNQQRT